MRRPEGKYAAQDASKSHFLDRQRWFAFPAPNALIRICEERVAYFGKPRSAVGAILISRLLRSKVLDRHQDALVEVFHVTRCAHVFYLGGRCRAPENRPAPRKSRRIKHTPWHQPLVE